MTDISHAADVSRRRHHRGERLEFRLLLAATYPLFLAAALAQRAGGLAAGSAPARGRRPSVFAEAYETAAASLAYAFMG